MAVQQPLRDRKGPGSRKPNSREIAFLLTFHAILSGAFVISYLTGDEDTYGMHVFTGYTVLGALGLRLLIGMLMPAGSPLRLPRPSPEWTRDHLGRILTGDAAARSERSPLHAWMAVGLLVGVTLAALTGVAADFRPRLDDLHEVLANLALFIVFAHIALVLSLHGLKRWAHRVPAKGPLTDGPLSAASKEIR
ncbi:cytochrome b/b6 domain-containing protein [Microvirga massiliensis]|uniref:cytochrome b/b6 domain-containing protein n=1 Tax=Microvirga massiliensis TaxID=1033741 RepID=UPI00065FAC9A|nr:cytochrome b/b6 domain-containing protein [Microvirga massiliensis]